MNIIDTETKSCIVADPMQRNHATSSVADATANATAMQPTPLKALARAVLERNPSCNFDATGQKITCNFGVSFEGEKLHCSISQLHQAAGEDWEYLCANREALQAFDDAHHKSQLMRQGKIPDDYTVMTHCHGCGDVLVHADLANGGHVLGCPWCWIRAAGVSLPCFH